MHPIDWKKNCTWQAEKTAGAFCAGCPYISLFKVLFFLQTSFLSALWLSALPPRQVQKRSAIPIRAHSLRSALYIECRHAVMPGYTAASPSSSSMRRSWLYFATRSVLLGAPVLIWQVFNATARSAIVVSSVSPERWEEIAV